MSNQLASQAEPSPDRKSRAIEWDSLPDLFTFSGNRIDFSVFKTALKKSADDSSVIWNVREKTITISANKNTKTVVPPDTLFPIVSDTDAISVTELKELENGRIAIQSIDNSVSSSMQGVSIFRSERLVFAGKELGAYVDYVARFVTSNGTSVAVYLKIDNTPSKGIKQTVNIEKRYPNGELISTTVDLQHLDFLGIDKITENMPLEEKWIETAGLYGRRLKTGDHLQYDATHGYLQLYVDNETSVSLFQPLPQFTQDNIPTIEKYFKELLEDGASPIFLGSVLNTPQNMYVEGGYRRLRTSPIVEDRRN